MEENTLFFCLNVCFSLDPNTLTVLLINIDFERIGVVLPTSGFTNDQFANELGRFTYVSSCLVNIYN